MKYRLSSKPETEQAFEYLTKLAGLEATVEVKRIFPARSLPQNSYYHLLLGIFGLEYGWTVEEAKSIHKRIVSPAIFVYEKNSRKFLRSSADLDTKQMSNSIEQLKKYAAEQGLILPDAGEEEKLLYYDNLIEKEGLYL